MLPRISCTAGNGKFINLGFERMDSSVLLCYAATRNTTQNLLLSRALRSELLHDIIMHCQLNVEMQGRIDPSNISVYSKRKSNHVASEEDKLVVS